MMLAYLFLILACFALGVSALVGRARGWRPPIEARQSEVIAGWCALAVALAVSGWLIFAPAYGSRSTTVDLTGRTVITEQSMTLLESGAVGFLFVLAAVVIVVATPLILRRHRARYWIEVWGALALAVLSFLGGFSIGIFLLPVAALMFVAALLGRMDTSGRRVGM